MMLAGTAGGSGHIDVEVMGSSGAHEGSKSENEGEPLPYLADSSFEVAEVRDQSSFGGSMVVSCATRMASFVKRPKVKRWLAICNRDVAVALGLRPQTDGSSPTHSRLH